MIRAKFRVTSKGEAVSYGDDECCVSVSLSPVYESGDDGNAVEENRIFGKATPSGTITLDLRSRAAADALEIGRSFYVDFTPAEN